MKAILAPELEMVPAAQYIRMSTEHQRYSPDNQQSAIALYASLRGFQVVETYLDAGKSGLTLHGRPALKKLLSDAISGTVPYKAILVLDVSRWGRFQDTDQAAHYEYMCREAGIDVHYCNEPFQNQGGSMSSIVKHMKRVMAAEYSRELSAKVSRAQRQQARLGFKQGGLNAFGTRRQVVDEHGTPRFLLAHGERKALNSDRVVLVPGPPEEVALVRRIYRMFVREQMSLLKIVRWLNERGHTHTHGGPWKPSSVRSLLCNEIYLGKYIFGRVYSNVGAPYPIPPEEWIKVDVIKPIISKALFLQAAARLAVIGHRTHTHESLLDGLKRLLEEKGRLSVYLIKKCPYLPTASSFVYRFGSLSAAYNAIGYAELSPQAKKSRCLWWSDEQLLGVLRQIYRENGAITRKVLATIKAPSRATIFDRFGGLLNAMVLAGLPMEPLSPWQQAMLARQRDKQLHRKQVRRSQRPRAPNGGRISDAELDETLRRLLAAHGYLSAMLIHSDPTAPAIATYRVRFGGLKRAYGRIGYLSSRSEVRKAANRRAKRGLPEIS